MDPNGDVIDDVVRGCFGVLVKFSLTVIGTLALAVLTVKYWVF